MDENSYPTYLIHYGVPGQNGVNEDGKMMMEV